MEIFLKCSYIEPYKEIIQAQNNLKLRQQYIIVHNMINQLSSELLQIKSFYIEITNELDMILEILEGTSDGKITIVDDTIIVPSDNIGQNTENEIKIEEDENHYPNDQFQRISSLVTKFQELQNILYGTRYQIQLTGLNYLKTKIITDSIIRYFVTRLIISPKEIENTLKKQTFIIIQLIGLEMKLNYNLMNNPIIMYACDILLHLLNKEKAITFIESITDSNQKSILSNILIKLHNQKIQICKEKFKQLMKTYEMTEEEDFPNEEQLYQNLDQINNYLNTITKEDTIN
jgi:ATP-dependent phosphoenolpyruvate carboxykinase